MDLLTAQSGSDSKSDWNQIIKGRGRSETSISLSVAVFFFQWASDVTPGISRVWRSRVLLEVHEERQRGVLWFPWWGALRSTQGLSEGADETGAGSWDGLVGSVGFCLICFGGVQGLLVPLMVVKIYLSRNLKLVEGEGKKGTWVYVELHFPFALFLTLSHHSGRSYCDDDVGGTWQWEVLVTQSLCQYVSPLYYIISLENTTQLTKDSQMMCHLVMKV